MIDKEELHFTDDATNGLARATKYRKLVEETPEIISRVDSLLGDMYINSERFADNADLISKSIPMSGHTVGYYIGRFMLKQGGIDLVMKDFGNPYAFFKRYNDLALEFDYPSFSNESISLLEEMEKRYSYWQ